MATDELAQKLARRDRINEGDEQGDSRRVQVFNVYTEFKEFTRKQIKEFEKVFKKYVWRSTSSGCLINTIKLDLSLFFRLQVEKNDL